LPNPCCTKVPAIDTQSGTARLATAFARAKSAGRGALIPYLCAGDPDRETSAAMLATLADAGADIVELGIPYGDPLADGPTIAAAAQRSLDAGTTIDHAIELAANAAQAGAPPILMFTYFNPVLQYGLDRFAPALVRGGICGAIVPDVPLEESAAIAAAFDPRGLALPLLVAPTTPVARAQAIATASTGFVYIVSRLGVTSASKEPDFAWIAERVSTLRAVTATPLAIGFGISTAAHVRRAYEISDGAVVGSALIDAYAGVRGAEAVRRARAFLEDLAGPAKGAQ
jgi:tryptophan synthase alpha chain